jgi:hypothetical protein
MFDYEVRFYQELRSGKGHEHSAAVFARAEMVREQIFGRHCTLKRRAYSGGSLGDEPRYDPESERVDDVVSESNRRTVVHTTRSGGVLYQGRRRRYVLIRRGDDWLVDNVQVYDDQKAAWIRSAL